MISRSAPAPKKIAPFPRVFRVAILLEVLERLAFYGVYVNLSVYLTQTVHLTDAENGTLLGLFSLTRAWLPVATGALSDRLGFRRSLLLSFVGYAGAYGALFAFPSRIGAWSAIFALALAGAFLKPVIPGTVRRYAPEGREAQGFSIFYASVNAGSVVGKLGAKAVRLLISLRGTMINSVIASLIGLAVTFFAFFEPETEAPKGAKADYRTSAAPAEEVVTPGFFAALFGTLSNIRFVGFLVVVSGYYLLIDQFYQTFPLYIVRMFGDKAPREELTLINPLAIAVLQVFVARLTKRLPALPAMAFGILVGAGSMALMGAVPSLYGAGGSFFLFAIAEMIYSPRYYEYVSSFAAKGREGMTMGLALVPFGIGGLFGGLLSGRLVGRYLPKEGLKQPFHVWGTYAAIGVFCAFTLLLFGYLFPAKNNGDPAKAA